MSTETSNLGLRYLDPSQAQPEVKVNEAWDLIDAAVVAARGAGPRVAYASASGSINDVAPSGFDAGTGRLVVTLGSGDASWTGLIAGADGQVAILRNGDAMNTLTLKVADAGSSAANRFAGIGDMAIPPGASVRLVYDGTDTRGAMG